MLTAKKLNKVITIEENEKNSFISMGYDVYKDGEVVAYGMGKTVPYEKYARVVKELEALKKGKGAEGKGPSKQASKEIGKEELKN